MDLKLKEAFQKLGHAGGYCLMKTEVGNPTTLVTIRGPYGTEHWKESVGQGNFFVKPLKCNLSLEPIENIDEVKTCPNE